MKAAPITTTGFPRSPAPPAPPGSGRGAADPLDEEFRLLVEGVVDYAIFQLDPDGRVASWNAGARRIKGYSEAEILGRHFSCFYTPEDAAADLPERALHHAAGGNSFKSQGWRVRKDGSRFWADVVLSALRDDAGRLRGFAKITRDLTEQQQAATALRESAARLRAMMDHSPAVIFLKDLAGRYVDVNRRFEQEFGLAREAILGRTDEELFAPEQAAAFRANDALVLRTGQPERFEEVARYRDGEHVSVVSKFPLRDAAGQVNALCGIAIGITERKRMEEALRRANFTLQSIFDAAPVAVLSLDLAGRVTHWSRGAERLFGWTAAEALGRVCPTVPEDGLADFHQMIARVVAHGPETGLVRCRRKKHGELIHASLCPAPLRDARGEVVGVMVTLEDVTGRVRAEQALEEHRQALQRLAHQLIEVQETERRRLARELHDQIGQSLALLQVRLHGIRRPAGPAAVESVVQDSLTLLEALHGQVRELSLELRPSVLDELGLAPALRWHLDRVGQASGLRTRLVAASGLRRSSGDRETVCFRIAQEALANVVRHARAGSVTITLAERGPRLLMEIADDGTGFDLPRARQAARRGASLGLLNMEERVQAVAGKLEITTSPRGTTVRVTLPWPGAAAPQAQIPTPLPAA
jgi:PAS domain S-box-containing protein